MGCAAFAAFAFSAHAHETGVSQSDFVVEGRYVRASLAFARGEASLVARGGSEDAARDVVAKDIAIHADGDACEGALDAAGFRDDGYQLDATYACPHAPHDLDITLYFVDALPRDHRHVARAQAGATTAQALVDATHRSITLRIESNPRPAASSSLIVVLEVIAGIMITLAIGGSAVIVLRRRLAGERTSRRRSRDDL